MMRAWKAILLAGVLCGALGACGPNPVGSTDGGPSDGRIGTDGSRDGTAGGCIGTDNDTDGDGIPDRQEGTGDADNDGIPNLRDEDSDGDGRSDALEVNAGRPFECGRGTPLDSDGDGTPDFLDTDSDGNGIPDVQDFQGPMGTMPPEGGWASRPYDHDRDGIPDYADVDDDNDRINDAVEIAPGTAMAPADTDHDGRPDYRDSDSDEDTIRDENEGQLDPDGDGIPSFRDDDSDGDGISDREEAGDTLLDTPPVECERELDASNLTRTGRDGVADYLDIDSDNDGLSDQEERMYGTDRCNPDSDGDMQLDSAEVAWCVRNMRTGCATNAMVGIPSTDYYLILPNGGPIVSRELEFGTNIRVADVFFIFDTTGSMMWARQAVGNSIADPMNGLIASIRRVIPDTYFGVGHYDDFPVGVYGSGTDRAIHPLCDGPPGSRGTPECGMGTYGGIIMQPPTRAMDVQSGTLAIPGGAGGDGPESQVEALYQIVTNEGLYDRSVPDACSRSVGTAPCWVRPTACPPDSGGWGYPCFRSGALAIVVHYTDAPFHNGARDESPPSTEYYDPYRGISPAPHNFDEMVAAYQRRSAKQISIYANSGSGQPCQGRFYTNHSTYGPCYDFRKAAEGTGSVDLDGNPLIYDFYRTAQDVVVTQVTGAVNTLATRVPLDITTATRNDPTNPHGVDARRFIKRRVPSCNVATPTNTMCWTPPAGVPHNLAVGRTDLTTFYRVVPGTRVRFTIFFQNDGVFEGAETGVTLFHAYIDVLGDGVTRLDEREVFILVPAHQPPIG